MKEFKQVCLYELDNPDKVQENYEKLIINNDFTDILDKQRMRSCVRARVRVYVYSEKRFVE